MAWEPSLDIRGDVDRVRVSSTDVASQHGCGRYLAFKIRPQVKAAAWQRSFLNNPGMPFPLADVSSLVLGAHQVDGLDDHVAFRTWLHRELDNLRVHRLLRPYVEVAVENVLDAHESIEAAVGPLRLIARDPQIGPVGRLLWAWAPLYETNDGTREIRRLRVGSVHDDPTEDDARWTATAAYVAAGYRGGLPARRVRVVEIGPVDGSIAVPFDGTVDEARALFASAARDRTAQLVDEDHVVPCRSCGDCKVAGACTALLPVPGLLGQATAGIASRSVSPTSLEKYGRCPAQWLLDDLLHLPKERGQSEAVARGNAAHRWLEAAHKRGVPCTDADLPDPGVGLGLAHGLLSADDYALARPFLQGHVGMCPLRDTGVAVVATEEFVHGWDETAQVVSVTRPDLVYMLGDRLVVRETKTMEDIPVDVHAAYDKHLQVPFLLALLATGLVDRYGATSGTVELEALGPDRAEVWAWDTDNPAVLAVARSDVRNAVEGWHTDSTWNTAPGPHCDRCPVREWCPDRDVWSAGTTASALPSGSSSPVVPTWDDEPPF